MAFHCSYLKPSKESQRLPIKALLKHFWCCWKRRAGIAQGTRNPLCLKLLTGTVNTMSSKVQDEQQPNFSIKVLWAPWAREMCGRSDKPASHHSHRPSALNPLRPLFKQRVVFLSFIFEKRKNIRRQVVGWAQCPVFFNVILLINKSPHLKKGVAQCETSCWHGKDLQYISQ